ncbi:hypothetical protein JB92DRAFT_2811135 [Gautieria morchelliformis]|nr:hypothetical protein JB92DRAFT_2811135 [Gautieria morchelliformis]
MSPITIQRVQHNHPSESLVDACANLFAMLMKDNTAPLSLCGGEASLIYYLARGMILACALDGEYYIALNEENDLAGFCLWMPPGKVIFSTEEQRLLGFDDFMARLPEVGKDYYRTTYFVEFPKFVAKCLGKTDWNDDFWWLHTLMVRPESQRQGVGRALLQPVREKAAQAVEPIALSTTSQQNASIYTSLGLHLLDSRIMPSPWGDWPLYVFALDPRSRD